MSQVVPTLRLERLLPGPIERVWEYLAQPELRRTWLAEAGEITRCIPPQSLECSLPDSSLVRFDLETRGPHVLLILTHRRIPAYVIGICTTLIAALLAFMSDGNSATDRRPQYLGVAYERVEQADPPS